MLPSFSPKVPLLLLVGTALVQGCISKAPWLRLRMRQRLRTRSTAAAAAAAALEVLVPIVGGLVLVLVLEGVGQLLVDTGGVVLRSLLVGHLDEVRHPVVVVALELAAGALDGTARETAMFRHHQGSRGSSGRGSGA